MNLNDYFKLFISVFIVYFYTMDRIFALLNNYQAQKSCAIKKVKFLADFVGKEIFYGQELGLKCDITHSNFTLDNESYKTIERKLKKYQNRSKSLGIIEFNWPSFRDRQKQAFSLTKKFNLASFLRLFKTFDNHPWVYFHNLHSIELDLFDEKPFYSATKEIQIINSDLRFAIDGKHVKTCADITSAARKEAFKISSLFQIPFK